MAVRANRPVACDAGLEQFGPLRSFVDVEAGSLGYAASILGDVLAYQGSTYSQGIVVVHACAHGPPGRGVRPVPAHDDAPEGHPAGVVDAPARSGAAVGRDDVADHSRRFHDQDEVPGRLRLVPQPASDAPGGVAAHDAFSERDAARVVDATAGGLWPGSGCVASDAVADHVDRPVDVGDPAAGTVFREVVAGDDAVAQRHD